MRLRIALAAVSLAAGAAAQANDKPAARIAALLAQTDGATKETAYKVSSVDEEYQVLRARHLSATTQSLVIGDDKRPYDVLDVKREDGTALQLWFDIKSFYGHELGF